jgi:hypothetical protein
MTPEIPSLSRPSALAGQPLGSFSGASCIQNQA